MPLLSHRTYIFLFAFTILPVRALGQAQQANGGESRSCPATNPFERALKVSLLTAIQERRYLGEWKPVYNGPPSAAGAYSWEDLNFSIYNVNDHLADAAEQLLNNPCGKWLLNLVGSGQSSQERRTNRVAAAAASPAGSGQASEVFLFADLTGNGIPDVVYPGTNGIWVGVLNAQGSVLTANQYPTGFTADPFLSTIVAADFNGDGKLDLAVSDPGNPGSDNGGVAILLGNGDGTFQAAKYFPAGQNPSALAAADFNGDGKVDLAAGSSVGGTIAVLPGNGDGTFGAPASYGNGGDSQAIPVSILAIDLNGDGRPDLAVANQGFVTVPTSSISTLLNTGSGFQPKFNAPLPLALIPNFLAYSDLNNDGKTDLIAISPSASAVVTLFGNGDGTFEAPAYYAAGNSAGTGAIFPLSDGSSLLATPDVVYGATWFTSISPQGVLGAPILNMVGGAPTGLAVADLNGDGTSDAVVTGGLSDVSVLLGQSNGLFQAPVGYSLAQPSPMPQAVAIGDLNNDGKPDVVVASAGQPGSSGMVSVLLGNGDGTLQAPQNTTVNAGAQSIALADFNGDGKLDAVVAAFGNQANGGGSDAGGIVVLLGGGNGTLTAQPPLTVSGLYATAVTAADLNGDGIPDLAAVMISTPNQGKSTLAVFLGKGDGTFQSPRTFPLKGANSSLSGVISNLGGIVVGDWNGDGKPDIAAVSQADNTSIDVLLGDGTGNFTEVSTLPATEDTPVYLATADVNRDGKADLIVAHCCSQNDATYLLGNGNGTFQAEQQLLTGNSPAAVGLITTSTYTTVVSADNQAAALTAVSIPAAQAGSSAPLSQLGSAAGGVAALAPGSLAMATGTDLANAQAIASGLPWPASLGGSSISVQDSAGATTPAPLGFVSPGQVDFQIPDSVATGAATVLVTSGDGTASSASVTLTSLAPALFTLNSASLAAGDAFCVSSSGARAAESLYQLVNDAVEAAPLNLAACAQTILQLYATGLDKATANGVQVTIGGVKAAVQSVGPQGSVPGVDQISFAIPATLAGKGSVSVSVSAGGLSSNTVNVTIH